MASRNAISQKNRIFHNLQSSVRYLPYVLSRFRCKKIRTVDIELTNRCNLHCKMCWFYGESGIGDKYRDLELSSSEITHLIDQLLKYKPNIYLGGAEPFMRQDLFAILEYIKRQGLFVSLTTNGTLLDHKKTENLVTLKIDKVNFSIDGPEELHDQNRGRGSFKKVILNIKELSDCKKKRGSVKPITCVHFTITKNVINHLKGAIHSVKDATNDGVDIYLIHHLWYLTQKELLAHRSTIKQLLGCTAVGSASHLIPNSQVSDPKSLADEITFLKNWPKVKAFPDLSYNDILKYYSEGGGIKERCIAPFLGAVVKPNGDVKFCPDEWVDDFVLGNVRNDSFDKIWNNDRARKFRAVLFNQKNFAGCKRCSWMYSF